MRTNQLSLVFLAIACLFALVAAFLLHSVALECFGLLGLLGSLVALLPQASPEQRHEPRA